MSISKSHFPYLAHYVGIGQTISFSEKTAEIDSLDSKVTVPLGPSTFQISKIPEQLRNSPKKVIRWLLKNDYTPTLKEKEISWTPPVLSVAPVILRTLEGHSNGVNALCVLPDGTLASGSKDNTIKLWNPITGECIRTLQGHSKSVTTLCGLPDGTLASGSADHTIKLWNPVTGECIRTLQGHSYTVWTLCVLPNGTLASGSGDNTIKLWNSATGQCIRTLQGHSNDVMTLCVLQDGILASGSWDKTIKLWNPVTGQCIRTLGGHSSYVRTLCVLQDGTLASGSDDHTIKLWNPATGQCIRTLEGHSKDVLTLYVLLDGTLASGSWDTTIKLWNPVMGQCIRTLEGHSSYVCTLCVLPNGTLASGSDDHTIKLWKTSSPSLNNPKDQILIHCDRAAEQIQAQMLEDDNSHPENLSCPLTLGLFKDPVIDEHGHTFEKSAIDEHLKNQNTCPLNRAPLKESLKPNRVVKELADLARKKISIPTLALETKDAKKASTYLELGNKLIQEGDYPQALELFAKGLSFTHRSEDYVQIPELYQKMGQPLKAVLAYLYLLKYQLKEGKTDLAKKTLQKASQLGASTHASLNIQAMKASFLQLQGNASEALCLYVDLARGAAKEEKILYLERALQCNPGNPQIYEQLASCYPDPRKVNLFLLAFTHLYHADKKLALSYYQKARQLAPDFPLVPLAHLSRLDKTQTEEKIRTYRLLADLMTGQKNTSAALVYLRKAIRSEKDQDFRRYLNALLQLQERREAERVCLKWSSLVHARPVDILEEALRNLGESAPLLERLFTVYIEMKNPALKEIAAKLGALYEKENQIEKAVRIYEFAYQKFKDVESGYKLADLRLRQEKIVECFYLYYNLTQEAFFSEQPAEVQRGLKKIQQLKPGAHLLNDSQKQFLLMAGMIEKTMTEKQALALKVEALSQEVQELKASQKGHSIAPKPAIDVAKITNVRTLKGHSALVRSITSLLDGTLASGSDDHSIKLWNPVTGKCIRTLEGHSKDVWTICVLPDGTLASGSRDHTIKLWNPTTGKCIRTLEGHSKDVYILCVLPDGILASGSEDHTIKLWNPATGKCIRTLQGHSDGVNALCVLSDGALASGSWDHTIKLWNTATGKCIRTLQGHSDPVNAICLLPDGTLASGSLNDINLWNPITGECLRTLKGHSDPVNAICVLPDGTLASGSDDMTIKLWNPITGECLRTLKGHSDLIGALHVMPDGTFASGLGEGQIQLWK